MRPADMRAAHVGQELVKGQCAAVTDELRCVRHETHKGNHYTHTDVRPIVWGYVTESESRALWGDR